MPRFRASQGSGTCAGVDMLSLQGRLEIVLVESERREVVVAAPCRALGWTRYLSDSRPRGEMQGLSA